MSEDDGGRKEEMKKSIFMKRKSNESSASVSPRSNEDKRSPERKGYNNPFSFSHAKKATNDIIQNEILKNEIMKRKNEELSQNNNNHKSKHKDKKSMSYSSSSEGSTGSSGSDSSGEESEYEIHEVYQLKEWFPPDLKTKPAPQDSNSKLTLIQSRSVKLTDDNV